MRTELDIATDYAIKYRPYISRKDVSLLCTVGGVSYYQIKHLPYEAGEVTYVTIKNGVLDMKVESDIMEVIRPNLQAR